MSDLDKQVSGDWIDVRDSATDFYGLNNRFRMSVEAMRAERRALGLANEEGMTEYKRTRLVPVFAALEDMLYKTLTQDELERQVSSLHTLLFVTMLQRCVVLGTVGLVRGPDDAGSDLDLNLKMVVGDVHERLKADPTLQKHAAVKSILLLVKRYQAEMAKMKDLEPKIKADAKLTFLANFRETFADIAGSIKKHYAELLKEQRAGEPSGVGSLARRVPLKGLSSILTQQATVYARMRSTLTFAVAEKFRTRDLLAGVHRQKAHVLGLLDTELSAYASLCREHLGDGSHETAVRLSKSFRDELTQILERQERVDQP
jgi:hypothetical protein